MEEEPCPCLFETQFNGGSCFINHLLTLLSFCNIGLCNEELDFVFLSSLANRRDLKVNTVPMFEYVNLKYD